MATPGVIHRLPISAHLEPLASSTPVNRGPYSRRLHPVLSSRATPEVHSHRQKIVKEIFDTEHSYISQLNTIVSFFLKPIRVGCLLPPDATAAVFSNVEGILSVNLELFACMRQHSLGEAFSYLAPFLKLYSTYAANFLTANDTLQAWLKRSPDFAHFVSSQESRPECCGLSLSTLIVTPIQRIPRYKLLLEGLLQYTKPTHPDYSKLNAASAQVAAVASHINEHIRQHEDFRRMLAIQNRLTGQCVPRILAPGRKYIQEGRVMKVCRRKAKERMLFLFSDMLIYARPNPREKVDAASTYECRCTLPLLNSSVQVVPADHRVPTVSPLFKVSNEDTSLLFFSYNQDEVYQWAQAIESAIRSLQLAFGSLVTTMTAGLLHMGTGGVALGGEIPLGTGAEYDPDSPPASPYPLTATMMSSHSLEDLSSGPKGGKRDSSFSEQLGAGALGENGFLDARFISGDPTALAGKHALAGATWPSEEHPGLDNRGRVGSRPRPSSSGPAGPSGRRGERLTPTVFTSRPQSSGATTAAAAAIPRDPGERADGGGAGWAEEGGAGWVDAEARRRRRSRHKSKSRGHHRHRDTDERDEAVVLANEYVLRESEGEELLEVPDETPAPPAVANGGRAAQLRGGGLQTLHALSSGSLHSNLAQSKCCTIL